ncbi:MAG TPA: hypothetical protein VE132_10970, partial [Micromonosporaceae bacterium]|nr:hypothetical protein [Micromonosporaceae bacterium]
MERVAVDRDAGAVRFVAVRRALTLRAGDFFAGAARLATADFTVRLPVRRAVVLTPPARAAPVRAVPVRPADVRFVAAERPAALRADVVFRAVVFRAVVFRAV